jgi:S1-C subfamily serine protease
VGTVLLIAKDGRASGWVIDRERGLVITDCHVIDKDDEPRMIFPEMCDGRVIVEPDHYAKQKKYLVGTVVLKDKERDLALVSR